MTPYAPGEILATVHRRQSRASPSLSPIRSPICALASGASPWQVRSCKLSLQGSLQLANMLSSLHCRVLK